MKPNYQYFGIDESLEDRITVWIDVPGRSVNALSEPVFDELSNIIDTLMPPAQHLPIVFRSAKRGSFVVGADLRRILSIRTDAEIQQFLLHGQLILDRLANFEGTTVSVIHGACLGGGLEFALACKFRIGVDSVTLNFGMPESKLGLMPGWGGTQRLVERIGVTEGLNMLLSGDSIQVRRAWELRLVDAIVQQATLEEEVTTILHRLTEARSDASGCHAIRRTDKAASLLDLAKFDLAQFGMLSAAQEAIYQAASIGIKQTVDAGLKAERELFYPLLMSAEAQENLQNFVNRSKPSR
jgi:3-hydroxyacyl-CoA dehydrogenase / enoyl-CoA hydratase / 3-hydroxybutyryl-CoA epimerase